MKLVYLWELLAKMYLIDLLLCTSFNTCFSSAGRSLSVWCFGEVEKGPHGVLRSFSVLSTVGQAFPMVYCVPALGPLETLGHGQPSADGCIAETHLWRALCKAALVSKPRRSLGLAHSWPSHHTKIFIKKPCLLHLCPSSYTSLTA